MLHGGGWMEAWRAALGLCEDVVCWITAQDSLLTVPSLLPVPVATRSKKH